MFVDWLFAEPDIRDPFYGQSDRRNIIINQRAAERLKRGPSSATRPTRKRLVPDKDAESETVAESGEPATAMEIDEPPAGTSATGSGAAPAEDVVAGGAPLDILFPGGPAVSRDKGKAPVRADDEAAAAPVIAAAASSSTAPKLAKLPSARGVGITSERGIMADYVTPFRNKNGDFRNMVRILFYSCSVTYFNTRLTDMFCTPPAHSGIVTRKI